MTKTNASTSEALQTNKIPNMRFALVRVSDPSSQNVAVAILTALITHTITITLPPGATITSAILMPSLKSVLQAAATHHVIMRVDGKTSVGAWVTLYTGGAFDGVGGVNMDAAPDGWGFPIGVGPDAPTVGNRIVTVADTYSFRIQVTSDNAGSIDYTFNFLLKVEYSL